MRNTNKQRGAVSLFVVIFAALLITVVTVSFIRIMIQDQEQSTANDLSQSAYDSAQAGVEDGKRALLLLQSICSPDPFSSACTTAEPKYTSTSTCNDAVGQLSDVLSNATMNGSDISEVKVQTTKGDENLNQAYTCVKIITNTSDVEGYLATDASTLIPLNVGTLKFNKIQIQWFTSKNLLDPNNAAAIVPTNSLTPLPMKTNWPANQAPVIRAQLIEFGSTFNLNDVHNDKDTGNGWNNTLFLYPSNITSVPSIVGFKANSHPTTALAGTPGTPSNVICNDLTNAEDYSCSATLQLQKPIDDGNYLAYLNLESIYKPSNYIVTLWNDPPDSTKPVPFNNVQPEIDSTGRANDLFRRVVVRVEYSNISFPFPQGEINVTGNFCKDFMVTNNPRQYVGNTNICNPAN